MKWIPLNKPSYGYDEEQEVLHSLRSGHIQGDGPFTKKVHDFFELNYQTERALFTTSCTAALELAALLLDIRPNDEVIVPSYTLASTAHAFALRGAKIVFADSRPDHPNICLESIKSLVTSRTRAVVPVHYAGFACEMDELMSLASEKGFVVIADAAQAISSRYHGKSAVAWGHMSALSFHQTKNISCGEGGMLLINDKRFSERAQVLRGIGTNRAAFFRGEVDFYECVDIGSSFLGSDLLASLLWAQLQRLSEIQGARAKIWDRYHQNFQSIENAVTLPKLLPHTEHNSHCYYLVCDSLVQRSRLNQFLKDRQIGAVFHYQSLHKSSYYKNRSGYRDLPNADRYTKGLLRLPLFPQMTEAEQNHVIESVLDFFD